MKSITAQRISKTLFIVTLSLVALGAFATSGPQTLSPTPTAVADRLIDDLVNLKPNAPTHGMWTAPARWPVIPIHASLLPDGRVLTYGSPEGALLPSGVDTNDRGPSGVELWRESDDHLNFSGQDGRYIDLWTPTEGLVKEAHARPDGDQLSFATDSFCNASKLLPQGLLLVAGNDFTGRPNGEKNTDLFDYANNQLELELADMRYPRWYGSLVRLADDRMVALGGAQSYEHNSFKVWRNGDYDMAGPNYDPALPNGGDDPSYTLGERRHSTIPEIFTYQSGNPAGSWQEMTGAQNFKTFGRQDNAWWYPRAYLAPNGRIFGVSWNNLWTMDPDGGDATNPGSTIEHGTIAHNVGASGASVMFEGGHLLFVGGGQHSNEEIAPGLNQATVIDITTPTEPIVSAVSPMTHPRNWGIATALPTGEVLVSGGTTHSNRWNDNLAVFQAEIWNPETRTFRLVDSAKEVRNYHAVALLLPNGTVFTGGGGVPPFGKRDAHSSVNEGPGKKIKPNFTAEIYYPPYLFTDDGHGPRLADRPTITLTTADVDIAYGAVITADVSAGSRIDLVTFISLGSITHSQNMDQRLIKPYFEQVGNELRITLPDNKNLLPPGDYMLHAVDDAGVPSIAAMVQLDKNNVATSSDATSAIELARTISLESVNFPGYRVRHVASEAFIVPIDAGSTQIERDDAAFRIVNSLAGEGCVSFESRTYPGSYLRGTRSDFRVELAQDDGSVAFAAEASFCARQGLSGQGLSFEWVVDTSRMVRHRNYAVWVDQNDGTQLFGQDSSFLIKDAYR